jgi:hypothetical protein
MIPAEFNVLCSRLHLKLSTLEGDKPTKTSLNQRERGIIVKYDRAF